MKAIRYYATEDVRVEEVSKPVAAEGEALIKVLYSGICGSDLHNYSLGMFMTYVPETMGHEFVGIIETAPEESGLVPGDLVVGNPSVFCHECSNCLKDDYIHCENIGFIGEVRPGSDAEFVALPADTLIKVKKDVDPVQAGIIEPLTVALHTCKDKSEADRLKLIRKTLVIYTLVALVIALMNIPALPSIALCAFEGLLQFIPLMLFGVFWKRANLKGVASGFIVGLLITYGIYLFAGNSFFGFNGCIPGVIVNIALILVFGFMSEPDQHVEELFQMADDYIDSTVLEKLQKEA